ncbi:MAG: Fe-S-cluster-containing hydrogenase [Kiritimatiellae bacterium]|nr:Fe-S-cluster-containing hydrogenase [Kiritimatiellia bacterium]MDW8459083.1 Fe-S-cluster-containing hydrogenase [Verrucomicrobiota bacterium]
MSDRNPSVTAGAEALFERALSESRCSNSTALWRSLEELAESRGADPKNLRDSLERYAAVAEWDPIDRRDFLRLMGASLALAGLTACTKQPEEKIVPYVRAPEDVVPGKPLFFATSFVHAGYAEGILAESHMGRPTKIEGNPLHPASLGGSSLFAQASVLQLYDPDRSQAHLKFGRQATWDQFIREVENELVSLQLSQGAGLRILTESVTSPTLIAQIRSLLERFPQAKWHVYEPVNHDNIFAGAELAFGEPLWPRYHFDKAAVVLSLDSDFLGRGPGHVRYARDFASRHSPLSTEGMSRLYVVESSASITGGQADHRLAVRASRVEWIARAIARGLGIDAAAGPGDAEKAWIEAVVRDLKRHRGAAVVLAGENQPPIVHALAHAMNEALDAFGKTVEMLPPVEVFQGSQTESIKELAADMKAGLVKMLFILGGNPVYTAPADCQFEEALQKVPFSVHHSLYRDETSRWCRWHIAATHYLEEWSDARAFDGTASIIQPLIEPLYSGRSAHEVMAALLGQTGKKGLELVQEHWKAQAQNAPDFEKQWRRWLHDGLVHGSAFAGKTVGVKRGLASEPPVEKALGASELELSFQPDYGTWDGRYANNGWLQEVPRPMTQIVWDNVVLLAPQTAALRRLRNGFVVELISSGYKVRAPVFVQAGHPEDCATVLMGGGRSRAGRVGNGAGFNAFALRSTAQPWITVGLARDTGETSVVVTTQEHHRLSEKHHARLYRSATLDEFRKKPDFVRKYDEFGQTPPSIYPDFDYTKGNQWGMVVNLNACIGCNACVVACQAENNIPVVGKDQVRRGREMHWIRVDRYFVGDPQNPAIALQPVTCMHCENAPCEAVCPVAATVHSREGLNQMVYNRCVGTRYCSNNCPYKVRRFNFYKFADHTTPSLKLQRNPDVTVRARGVMEKCTFCVQRISEARIEAKKKGRLVDVVQDGLQTACQQACPTRAIVFGDINNPEDPVAKLRALPLNYGMLVELNTRPRLTYLAKVRNPNPDLEQPAVETAHGEHA